VALLHITESVAFPFSLIEVFCSLFLLPILLDNHLFLGQHVCKVVSVLELIPALKLWVEAFSFFLQDIQSLFLNLSQ